MSEPSWIGDIHFFAGCISLAGMAIAFITSKGSKLHVWGGRVFVATMIALCISGLWMSISRNILFTVFLSLISFHAVVSGWATAASGKLNSFITRWSWVFSAVIVIGSSWGGYRATLSPNGEINDLPAGAFFFISAIAAIIFVLDINYIRSTSGSNMHRISRHLWRMGFAAFLATGIFFFGNNHVLPEVLRTPFKLSLPVLIVIIVTLLFSIKTYRGGFRKRGKIKT